MCDAGVESLPCSSATQSHKCEMVHEIVQLMLVVIASSAGDDELISAGDDANHEFMQLMLVLKRSRATRCIS